MRLPWKRRTEPVWHDLLVEDPITRRGRELAAQWQAEADAVRSAWIEPTGYLPIVETAALRTPAQQWRTDGGAA